MLRTNPVQLALNGLIIVLISFLLVLAMNPEVLAAAVSVFGSVELQSFKTVLISLILEVLPFILIGVLVSSFMQTFVSDRMIQRFIPRNAMMGIMSAVLLGIIFPVCECGLIPIIRRLVAKGMPLYVGVVFILTGPIVNPIVYASTYTAFRTRPDILYSRMGLAILVGAFIGLFVHHFVKKNPLKNSPATLCADSGSDHKHRPHNGNSKLFSMLEHSASEFFEMGKYLMFGTMVTAAIQTFVPRGELLAIGQGEYSSHLFMMGYAYILSLCSTSDAFVASSFAGTFSAGSLLSFLVFGPMLDLKTTLMFLSVFRTRFVLLLIVLITFSVFIGSNIFSQLFL